MLNKVSEHRDAILAALGRMTDAAKFEDLVRAALPSVDTRFRTLTPTGVGEHGKTVRDPVDGIGLAWNDQGQTWVTFQATTQQTQVAKKLHEDYDKALSRLPQTDGPRSHVVLALAVNTDVNSDVVAALVERGRKDDVLVHVVSATKLADILTGRENHGLAQAFLGVRPSLANEGSLQQASARSLEALESQLFGRPEFMPSSPALAEFATAAQFPLIELVGASGQGKTTTALQIGRRSVERGGVVLHIPETVVNDHAALSGAIDATLAAAGWEFDDSPGSFITSGRSKARVLLIVDDVQRLAAPQNALDRVRSWSRQLAKSAVGVNILCTRWPMAKDLQQATHTYRNRIVCMPPQRPDLIAYVRAARGPDCASLSEYAAGALVESLGDDPLLLGVHMETAKEVGTVPTAPEVWHAFIERGIKRASETGHLTTVEVNSAWIWLGDYLLTHGRLGPQPGLMREAQNVGHVRGVGALLESGMLVRPVGSEVSIRHDRLRDWHVGSRILAHHIEGDLDQAWRSTWDPYFNQGIADAVVQSGYDEALVSVVAEKRPEALFGTLRDPGVTQGALATMSEWTTRYRKSWHLQPGVEFAVRSIVGVHHSELPTILDLLPPWPGVLLARMAHGDVRAALAEFRPGLSLMHPVRDAALEAGLERYGNQLRAGLKRALENPPGDERIGTAIDLASAMRASDLAPLVRELADGKPELLAHAISYEYLTMPEDFASHGERSLRHWLRLRSELGKADYDVWIDGIRFAFANTPISEEATWALTELMLALDSGWEGAWLLQGVRTAYGAAATVRLFAQRCQGLPNIHEQIWFAQTTIFGQHMRQLRHIPADPEERPAIFDLAKNDDDDIVRNVATWVWFMDPRPEDLEGILDLMTDENEPQAVRARAEIGDTSIIPWIAEHARSRAHYIEWLIHVWGPEARTTLEEWLDEQLDAHDGDKPERNAWYFAHKVLLMAPRNDAREVLETRLDRLPPVRQLVQAALCVESEALRDWAINQVRHGPAPSPLLEYMFSGFGSDQDGPRVPITSAQVREWEPIFEYFRDRDLDSLYRICRRDGIEHWIRPRLQSRLWKYHRQELCPTSEDLEEELRAELERDHAWFGMRFVEDSPAAPEELLRALETVIEDRDIEDIAGTLEWPLRYWCTRETLEAFWANYPPTGPMSELCKRRATYFVAMQNPPS